MIALRKHLKLAAASLVFFGCSPVAAQQPGSVTPPAPYVQGIEYPQLVLPVGGRVRDIHFSPDGTRLRAFVDNRLHTWETTHWRLVEKIEADRFIDPPGMPIVMDVSQDGRWLAIGDRNWSVDPKIKANSRAGNPRLVRIIDVATQTVVQTLRGHGDMVSGLLFSPDGTRLLSMGFDDHLRVWEVPSGREVTVIRDVKSPSSLKRNADGTRAYFMTDWMNEPATALHVVDLVSGKRLQSIPLRLRRSTGVSMFDFSPDGRLALVHTMNEARGGGVHFWDTASSKELGYGCNTPATVSTSGIAFAPDSKLVVLSGVRGIAGQWDRLYYGFDVWEGRCATLLRSVRRSAKRDEGFGGDSAAISPNGRVYAYAAGSAVEIWDMGNPSGATPAALQSGQDAVEADALYRQGFKIGEERGSREAVAQAWLSAAQKGDPRAASAIAGSFSRGDGVPKDPAAAVRWARFAVERGDSFGRVTLVQAYQAAGERDKALLWANIILLNDPNHSYRTLIGSLEYGLPPELAEQARREAEACWRRLLRGC